MLPEEYLESYNDMDPRISIPIPWAAPSGVTVFAKQILPVPARGFQNKPLDLDIGGCDPGPADEQVEPPTELVSRSCHCSFSNIPQVSFWLPHRRGCIIVSSSRFQRVLVKILKDF